MILQNNLSIINNICLVVTVIALATAYISGWKIMSYLVNKGVIEKKVPLRCLSFSNLLKFYELKKHENGNYGIVGTLYIISAAILLIMSVYFIIT